MKRIKYFEGLRAIATLIVLGNHFAALFFPAMLSYSDESAHFTAEKLFSTTPLFALVNGQTAVIFFFILSGYLISNKYFTNSNNSEVLVSTALRRYFSLLLPCLFSVIVGYIIVKFSLTSADKVNPNYTLWLFTPSFKDALYQGFFGIFRGLPNPYNVSLWTILYEIPGTFLIVAILGVFGKYKKRYLIYILFILLSKNDFYSSLILCFVIGLFLNDLNINMKFNYKLLKHPLLHICLLIGGVFLTIYPVCIINEHVYLYGLMQRIAGNNDLIYRIIGASLIFFVLLNSTFIQKILSGNILNRIGEVSFSIYVIHLSILGTLSSGIFLYLNQYLNYNYSALITISVSYLLIYAIAVLIHKYINLNGIKLTNYIYEKLLK